MRDSDTLIQQYLEETLDEAGASQLLQLLKAQPELGEKLLQHLEVDAMLRATRPLIASGGFHPIFSPKKRFNRAVVTGVAALAACIIFLATWIAPKAFKSQHQPSHSPVAVFTRGVDVIWDSATFVTPGTPLSPSLLKLKSGVAQIDFFQGARVAIAGPAEFQLISSNEATCTLGKLSAQVPLRAKGFRINTPKGSVVDLGTEFGLEVNGARSEVHVFKGEVAMHKTTGSVQSLKEGQAMTFAADSKLLAANPSSFGLLNKINNGTDLAEQAALARWQTRSAELKADPSLIYYFDFEEKPSARLLRNHGSQGEDGILVGTQSTEGRWPNKKALDFLSANDRVKLNIPDETTAFTMVVSVRIDSLNKTFNCLMTSDGWGARKVHWQIKRNGKLHLGTGFSQGDGFGYSYDTPVYFTSERLGSWVHLVVVYDAIAKEVRHYANGDLLARLPITDSPLLKIGSAEIGNWNKANNGSKIDVRHLNGAMDEFAFWNRALSDAEIDALVK